MSTTAAIDPATRTSSSPMMDMGTGSSDAGSDPAGSSSTSAMMTKTFFTATNTPLFSSAWTPGTEGAYVATCIFLIVLAALNRVLLAVQRVLLDRLPRPRDAEDALLLQHTYGDGTEKIAANSLGSTWRSHPFCILTEMVRGLFEVVTGGVGYLLMLAVMTMNVGYFMAVLCGIFLGALVSGRFSAAAGGHH